MKGKDAHAAAAPSATSATTTTAAATAVDPLSSSLVHFVARAILFLSPSSLSLSERLAPLSGRTDEEEMAAQSQ